MYEILTINPTDHSEPTGSDETYFPDIVRMLRESTKGTTGPAPADMDTYADPEVVWRLSSPEGKLWDDETGLLDGITTTVNKLAARKSIIPSDELNQAIADKLSLVLSLIHLDTSKRIPATYKRAVERLVLNFTDAEVAEYLGDQFIETLIEDSSSDEIESAVSGFFSQHERLRRASNDRNAYSSSRQSVALAAEIASNRQEYLARLGIDNYSDSFVAALSAYNLLTLTTVSPENPEASLKTSEEIFTEAAARFPLLAEKMPQEMLTIILRRGGSERRQKVDRVKIFSYFERKEHALRVTGSRYITRTVGGATPSQSATRGQSALGRAKYLRSNGLRGEIALGLESRLFHAIEFDPEIGEQIMQIAERDGEASTNTETLGKVANILESTLSFTSDGILSAIDAGLADDIRRGISTRTSEILYALNQRQAKGKSTEKPEAALAKLEEWADGIAEMLQTGIPQKVQEAGDTKLYHFINPETGLKYPGTLELTTFGKFAEGATAREQYVKEGRGARASFTFDAVVPELALSLNGSERRMAMNGRFDKSVYDSSTGKDKPDAAEAQVSFDIASTHSPAGSQSRIVAEVLAEGSAIRATGNGRKGGAGNYTYDIINQDHGKRDVFAEYMKNLSDILDERARSKQRSRTGARAVAAAERDN